jgi:hypothetical protein
MALFKYPNSKNWWYEFHFAGQLIRETTVLDSRTSVIKITMVNIFAIRYSIFDAEALTMVREGGVWIQWPAKPAILGARWRSGRTGAVEN